jgi:phosphopantetheine adenylyltransferase
MSARIEDLGNSTKGIVVTNETRSVGVGVGWLINQTIDSKGLYPLELVVSETWCCESYKTSSIYRIVKLVLTAAR